MPLLPVKFKASSDLILYGIETRFAIFSGLRYSELTGPSTSEKLAERRELLKRVFSKIDLFNIGKELGVSYFEDFLSGWEIDENEASFEIASRIGDVELKQIFRDHAPRGWAVFRGVHYMFEDRKLSLEGAGKTILEGARRVKVRYGSDGASVLKTFVMAGGTVDGEDLERNVDSAHIDEILGDLERLKVIASSYTGAKYREWKILEETLPIIEVELGMRPARSVTPEATLSEETVEAGVDYLAEEKQMIEGMDGELTAYLEDLLKHRLEQTIHFGKTFNLGILSEYLRSLFGSVLYSDSLLSITQQYGLANVEIVHEHGKTGKRTGWSLALFGEPGTGKSFSTRDMILGKKGAKIPPHGVPGRNRYCGGMTPARFIRIGEAYAGKVFNFIVPEFNDFFKYKGMVEPLKLAMEQGEIKYELYREVIGPYRFMSFFAVNYNVSVYDRGYATTVQDPNFNAIEDRMLCRLHRLTKVRFAEIAKSQMRLALGDIDIEQEAQKIRDHVTLVYAIETNHPLVKGRFPYKPVVITPQVYEAIGRAREAILGAIPEEVVKFSARLEDRALCFASAASLIEYFSSDVDHIPMGEEALRYAVRLYVEEASVRSREAFKPEEVLKTIYQG